MRPNILPAFVLCAVILIETKAQEQSFSGYNAFGSGEDSSYDNEGSGFTESGVEKVVDAMKKLNKSKSDAELSKNIKNGSFLKNVPIRTFEKLSALWISIIRRLWKVWRAKGARQVMRNIVEKLVTHAGKKISNNVEKALADHSQKRTETIGNELIHYTQKNENPDNVSTITDVQNDAKRTNAEPANEPAKTDASNTDVSTDSSTKQPAPAAGDQKSAFPAEKNALDIIGENETSTYSQPGSDSPGEEHIDSSNKQVSSTPQNEPKPQEDKVTTDQSGSYATLEDTKPMEETESKPQSVHNNIADLSSHSASLKENYNNQVKTGILPNQRLEDNQEIKDKNTAAMTDKQSDSLNSLSINVESPIAADPKTIIRNEKHSDTQVVNERKLNPQKQTSETITANSGSSQRAMTKKPGKRISQIKSKKRYRLHTHAHNIHKSSKFKNSNSKNTHSRYTNVNKYLIRRNKNIEQNERQGITERVAYQGPVSNEMESVLNVDAVQPSMYSKSSYGHRKRVSSAVSRSANRNNNEEAESGSSGEASGESTGNLRNERLRFRNKKHKYSRKSRRTGNRKQSARRFYGDQSFKPRNKNGAYRSASFTANQSLPTKSAKYVKGSKKFTFFTVNRDAPAANQTVENGAPTGHAITPIAADMGQPDSDVDTNQPEGPMPIPFLLMRPTLPQSSGFMSAIPSPTTTTQRPSVSSAPSNSLSNAEGGPATEDDAENVTVIAQPEGTLTPLQEPSNGALTEEVKGLESRLTVLEAAVAEVIEWIRSRNSNPEEAATSAPSTQVTLRPALPYPRPALETETEEQPKKINGLHGPRLLKQIFIPLPPPNSEAETEIENGQPVSGLPFPLNFMVAKMLAKMAKSREHHRFTTNHPHTPIPDVDIPAIEHDINRLEMELNSVPSRPFHHRHRHLKMHNLDSNEDAKVPLLGQLVNSEPEKDSPVCSASCKNGGICVDENTCKCPQFYTGAECEDFDIGRYMNSRRAAENPNQSSSDSSHPLVMSQFKPGFRREFGERKKRRKLVRVLNTLLQNLANENAVSSMRKDEIPSQRDYDSQEFEEIADPAYTGQVYR